MVVVTENKAQSPEKEAPIPTGKVLDEDPQQLPSGEVSANQLATEGEKQDEAEIGKETTKKLSDAAPPFNPSIIPDLNKLQIPGFEDHGGILHHQ